MEINCFNSSPPLRTTTDDPHFSCLNLVSVIFPSEQNDCINPQLKIVPNKKMHYLPQF